MAGQLWNWGWNTHGQLGDNTSTDKSSPIQTIAFGTDWAITSNGYGVRGAIKTNGTLWLWGNNANGQLGDNTTVKKSSPVQTIAGGNNWAQISVGYSHTAAIKNDGTLWLWGFNSYGKLGDNTTVRKSSPIQTIAGGTNWSQVSAGYSHTGAIKTDGTLWLWGRNLGNLGDSTTVSKSSPVQTITGGNNWKFVSCGNYITAAIKTDGTLWTWGTNYNGELGDNTLANKSSPVQTITGGNNWNSVSVGRFVVATKTDGTLWGWGANDYGQLGDNTTISKSSPVQTIAGGINWKTVSTTMHYGEAYVTAIKTNGTLWSWGKNNLGSLGDNTTVHKSSPVQTIAFGTKWAVPVGSSTSSMALYENDPYALTVTTQPAYAYDNNKILIQPQITAVDASGNPTSVYYGIVTAAVVSGTATLTGTTNIQADSGVATFTDLVLEGTGEATLQFTASGLTSALASGVNVEISNIAIVPKRTETLGRIPDYTQLRVGELAINIADKKGYVRKSDNSVVNVFTGLGAGVITSGMLGENSVTMNSIAPGAVGPSELASGVIGGNNSQVLYNSSGAITSTPAFTVSTTSGVVTIAPQNAGYNALTLRSYTSQSADLLKVQNSAGVDIAGITSSGVFYGFLSSGMVVSGNVASGQIGLYHLASGVISTAILGSGQVTSGNVASGQIGQFHLSSGAVNSGHIGNNAVVSGSIASGQITTFHLASGVLSTAVLGSGQVVSGNIASGQIGQFHLSSGAVNSGHIGNNAVVSGSIASGQVGRFHLSSGAVNSGHIGNNAVVSGSIASGQIGQFHLSSGAVNSGHIGQFAVSNINIVSGTIANDKLTNSSVTIAGSSTALGGSWAAAALTTASGLLTGTYYPSGALTIGIASGGVTSQMLADGSVTSGDIASGQIFTFHIASGGLLSGAIGSGQIGSAHIASGAVVSGDIGNNAVVSGSIASGQIGQMHLSSGAVNSGQIGNNAVVSGSIASGQIGANHIASGVINSQHIASGTISSEDIANNAIISGKIASGVIASFNLSSGTVLSGHIGNNAVTSGNIASGQITTFHLASGVLSTAVLGSGQVVSGNVGNNAIVSGSIASGQIGQFHLSSGAVNSGQIGNNAVVSGSIASGQIGQMHLSSGAVNSGQIGNGAVVSGSIASGSIGPSHLASGSLFAITNPADNRILTSLASGTNQANAETNLTYDGTTLDINSVSSGSTVFNIDGTSQQIMTVSDLVAGNILEVGNISGNPIFFINSSGTTNLSTYYGEVYTNRIFSIPTLSGSVTVQEWKNASGATMASVNTSGVFVGFLASGIVISGTIADNAIISGKIASGVVAWFNLASGAIRSGHIGDNAVVSGSIASGQITTFHLASGVLSTAVLGSGQVVSGNIGNNAVTSGNIASGQISRFHLSSGAVNSGHIGDNAVVSGSIASGQIGQFHIASGVITANHIASGAIIAADIADNAVVSGKIASGVVAWFNLSSGTVRSGHIGDGTVVSGSIASGQIFTFHIVNGGLLSGAIGSGQIGQAHLASGAVLSGDIGNAAVVSGSIASGAIGQMHLSSGAVNSGQIGNNAVVSGSIASGQVSLFHLASGTIAPAGTQGQVQYNASGAFAGASGLVYAASGTNVLITAQNANNTALVVQGASGQFADVLQIKNSSGLIPFAFGLSGQPKMTFTNTQNVPITLKLLDDAYGTMSFEGSAGQLFSIANILSSGIIFSANDISGIPSLDINADGTVRVAPFGGNVLVGTTVATSGKLQINTGVLSGKGVVVQAVSGQTANYIEFQNYSGIPYAYVNASGTFFGLLASGIVTSGAIASGSVGQFHLSSGAVNSGQIGNNAVVSGSIASGQITTFHLASGVLSTAVLGSGQVVSGNIASGQIGQFHLSSGAVNSGHIGNGAVVSGSIASGAIGIAGTSGQLQFNAGGVLGASAAVTFSSGGPNLGITSQATNVIPFRISTSSGHATNSLEVYHSGALSAYITPDGILYLSQQYGGTQKSNVVINGALGNPSVQYRNVVVGTGAGIASGASFGEGVAVGYNATVSAQYGVAIGQATNAGNAGVAIGLQSVATGQSSLGIGFLASVTHNNAIGLGSRATSTTTGDIVFATETANPTIRTQRFDASNNISYLFAGASTWIDSAAVTKTSRFTLSTYYTTTAQEAIRIDSNSDLARVAIGGAIIQSGRLSVYTGAAGNKGLIVQGFTSQSANFFEIQNSAASPLMLFNNSGNLGIGVLGSGAARLHVVGEQILNSGALTEWPAGKPDGQTAHWRNPVLISDGGNGTLNTAGTGTTCGIVIGENYTSRVVIEAVGGGNQSPSDQGTGNGKDMMLMGGASDNTAGKTGGRLFLQGGAGYPSAGYSGNYGITAIQPVGGNAVVGAATNLSGRFQINIGSGTLVGEVIRSFTSQTANLTEWQGTAGQIYARINASGEFFGLLSSGIVTSGAVASGQIGLFHLASGVISTATLGSGQVVSGNIASGQIGRFHLSSGAVNSGHIGDNAVVSGSIASGQVGQFHIASGVITANHIASGAIITADIADNAVVSGKIASGVVAWFNLSSGTVLSGHIGNNAVVSGSIASGQIGQMHLSSGTVNSGQIGNNAVVSGSVASGQISINHLASGVLSSPVILSGSIISGMIGNNAVVSGSIASGQIGTNHLSSGAAVNNIIANPTVASGINYITFSPNLSGNTGVFTNSGLIYNPGLTRLGLGIIPTSKFHLYESSGAFSSNVVNFDSYYMLNSGTTVGSGTTTYAYNFNSTPYRASQYTTDWAMRVGMTPNATPAGGVGSCTRGGLYVTVDSNNVTGNTAYGTYTYMRFAGHNTYGSYILSNGGDTVAYGQYISVEGSPNAYGIYAESSNTGGQRNSYAAHFRIPASVTKDAYGLLINTASITVSGYFYGAYIDGSGVTAGSGKVGLYVADGTSTAIIGNGSGTAASFTGGNVGIRTTTPSGALHVETGAASRPGVIIRGFTSQTGNLLEIQNSASNPFVIATPSGTLNVMQAGGTLGFDEIRISHDGTKGTIRSIDGDLQLGGGNSAVNIRNSGNTGNGYLNALGVYTTVIYSSDTVNTEGRTTDTYQWAIDSNSLNWNRAFNIRVGWSHIKGYGHAGGLRYDGDGSTSGSYACLVVTNGYTSGGTLAYYSSTTTISASTDNFRPTTYSAVQRLSPTANYNLTGMHSYPSSVTSGGSYPGWVHIDGRVMWLHNVSSTYSITLKHQQTSDAVNQFYTETQGDMVLGPGKMVQLTYDNTIQKWRVNGSQYPYNWPTTGVTSGYVFSTNASGTVSLIQSHLFSGAINSGQIGNGAVTSGNIASGQITSFHIASGVLSTAVLGSGQVVSGSIASGQIGQMHLSSGAVNSGHIGNNAVVSGSVASGQIGQFHIASGVITANHIASGAIITADIADNAVVSGKIASGVVAWFNLSSGTVLSGHIGNNAVTSGNIASGQIFTFHIASGGLLSGAIGSGQIGSAHIASGAVVSGEIGNAAVVSGSIASGQIGANHLASGTLFTIVNPSDNRILTSLASGTNQANAETNLTYDGTTLDINSASSGSTVFNIDGTLQQIMTVSDLTVGNVLEVGNISGNPVFAVNSTGYTANLGNIFSGQTSTFIAFSLPKTSGNSATFDYYTLNTLNSGCRAGVVYTVWDPVANTTAYNENQTSDLNGSTSGLTFTTSITSGNLVLNANIAVGTWNLKLGARIL